MPAQIQNKFELLLTAPQLSHGRETILRLRDYIQNASNWGLFRINVLQLAQELGCDERLLTDAFVHGAKIGLFDFQWNIICPGCGGIEYSLTSIGDLKERPYHCTICRINVPTAIDDQIEVAFSVNSAVRNLTLEPYTTFENYRQFFFSKNYERSQPLVDYSKKNFIGWHSLLPDQVVTWRAEVKPGESLRLLSMISHSELVISARQQISDQPQQLQSSLGATGFMPKNLEIDAGLVELKVQNLTGAANAATLMRADFTALETIMSSHPNVRKPFLTAKMLFNNQTYKDLFNFHSLPKDFNLRVRSLTLLFTDLKGSTQLYESAGDIEAFHIVQEHFKILIAIVRKNAGATIKTMGDALMASFSSPADAVRAGLEMLELTADFWRRHQVEEMGLKIGIHEGPALTISTDGRLDYFGQTVNMAARIQGQAQAGDLVVSADVYRDVSVMEILNARFGRVPAENVKLRGISTPIPIHRINPGNSQPIA